MISKTLEYISKQSRKLVQMLTYSYVEMFNKTKEDDNLQGRVEWEQP